MTIVQELRGVDRIMSKHRIQTATTEVLYMGLWEREKLGRSKISVWIGEIWHGKLWTECSQLKLRPNLHRTGAKISWVSHNLLGSRSIGSVVLKLIVGIAIEARNYYLQQLLYNSLHNQSAEQVYRDAVAACMIHQSILVTVVVFLINIIIINAVIILIIVVVVIVFFFITIFIFLANQQ